MAKDYSGKENYRSSARLKSRKNFHLRYSDPQVDMDQEVISQLGIKGSEALLDIGCGYGQLLRKLGASGHKGKLYGIDISEGMIGEAKSKTRNLKINLKVARAERLPFSSGTFDIVVCKHVLYHLNLPVALKEIRRVLKTRGILIITLNCIGDSRYHIESYKKLIAKELSNNHYLNSNARINFGNYRKLTTGFRTLKELKIYRYISLKNRQPLVDYVSTFREFWTPVPSDRDWERAMKKVGKLIDAEISKHGSFEEMTNVGIAILRKD